MDKEFYRRKIEQLSNDRLRTLLQKTENGSNEVIYGIAKKEAEARGLQYEPVVRIGNSGPPVSSDKEKLKKWNWGAFLLAPVWTLANKLEIWTILCFVPVVNIGVILYLGYNGNRLAFEKSTIGSVDDFMVIQKDWGRWGVRLFWFGVLVGLVALVVDGITDR